MASEVKLSLTNGGAAATLTLKDPIGPNNSWSCAPSNFLSRSSGTWVQGLGSLPVQLSAGGNTVLTITGLNMFDPASGVQSGDALHQGDGGTVGDAQIVAWTIASIS